MDPNTRTILIIILILIISIIIILTIIDNKKFKDKINELKKLSTDNFRDEIKKETAISVLERMKLYINGDFKKIINQQINDIKIKKLNDKINIHKNEVCSLFDLPESNDILSLYRAMNKYKASILQVDTQTLSTKLIEQNLYSFYNEILTSKENLEEVQYPLICSTIFSLYLSYILSVEVKVVNVNDSKDGTYNLSKIHFQAFSQLLEILEKNITSNNGTYNFVNKIKHSGDLISSMIEKPKWFYVYEQVYIATATWSLQFRPSNKVTETNGPLSFQNNSTTSAGPLMPSKNTFIPFHLMFSYFSNEKKMNVLSFLNFLKEFDIEKDFKNIFMKEQKDETDTTCNFQNEINNETLDIFQEDERDELPKKERLGNEIEKISTKLNLFLICVYPRNINTGNNDYYYKIGMSVVPDISKFKDKEILEYIVETTTSIETSLSGWIVARAATQIKLAAEKQIKTI